MAKRTIIVTGGNAGLGLAFGRELGRDADILVVIACRDLLRGEQAAIIDQVIGGCILSFARIGNLLQNTLLRPPRPCATGTRSGPPCCDDRSRRIGPGGSSARSRQGGGRASVHAGLDERLTGDRPCGLKEDEGQQGAGGEIRPARSRQPDQTARRHIGQRLGVFEPVHRSRRMAHNAVQHRPGAVLCTLAQLVAGGAFVELPRTRTDVGRRKQGLEINLFFGLCGIFLFTGVDHIGLLHVTMTTARVIKFFRAPFGQQENQQANQEAWVSSVHE